eukprot:5145391-Ditylum_brightwellii.AAC.1
MLGQTIKWLQRFQHKADDVVGGPFFQFTAKLWQLPTATWNIDEVYDNLTTPEWDIWTKMMTVVDKEAFPYLNLQMPWSNLSLIQGNPQRGIHTPCITHLTDSWQCHQTNHSDIPSTHCCTHLSKTHPQTHTNDWRVLDKGCIMPREAVQNE